MWENSTKQWAQLNFFCCLCLGLCHLEGLISERKARTPPSSDLTNSLQAHLPASIWVDLTNHSGLGPAGRGLFLQPQDGKHLAPSGTRGTGSADHDGARSCTVNTDSFQEFFPLPENSYFLHSHQTSSVPFNRNNYAVVVKKNISIYIFSIFQYNNAGKCHLK